MTRSKKQEIPGLVSVVVITYNQACFVRDTINSILSQDYQNIEIIISDDGSADGTDDIVEDYARQYPERIVPVLSKKNTGIASNFNRGLEKARGQYIAWLGGDDLMLPGKIDRQVELLTNRPDAVGCCHDAEVFVSFPSKDKVLGRFSDLYNGKTGFKEGGVELWFDSSYRMLPSSIMIRAKAIPDHGFDERLRYLNDWLFDVETFRHGKCAVINDVLVRYRRHDSNVTRNANVKKQLVFEESMIALGVVEVRYPELGRLAGNRRIQEFLAAAVAAYRAGDLDKCKSYLMIVIRHGAVVRGLLLYSALAIFGSYIARQNGLMPYERSWLYVMISNMMKR